MQKLQKCGFFVSEQSTMLFKLAVLVSLLITSLVEDENLGFLYNGFKLANLSLDGIIEVTSNRLLQHTGRAFNPNPTSFKKSTNGTVFSSTTTFVFGIISQHPIVSRNDFVLLLH